MREAEGKGDGEGEKNGDSYEGRINHNLRQHITMHHGQCKIHIANHKSTNVTKTKNEK